MVTMRKRLCGIGVVCVVFMLAVGVSFAVVQPVRGANTFVINYAGDDALCTTGSGVTCLRQAVTGAMDGDTITFNPTVFAAGRSTGITLFAPLDVAHSVTITGQGADTVRIQGQIPACAFAPITLSDRADAAPAPVTITGVTLTNCGPAISVAASRALIVSNVVADSNGGPLVSGPSTMVTLSTTTAPAAATGDTATVPAVIATQNAVQATYNAMLATNAAGGGQLAAATPAAGAATMVPDFIATQTANYAAINATASANLTQTAQPSGATPVTSVSTTGATFYCATLMKNLPVAFDPANPTANICP